MRSLDRKLAFRWIGAIAVCVTIALMDVRRDDDSPHLHLLLLALVAVDRLLPVGELGVRRAELLEEHGARVCL